MDRAEMRARCEKLQPALDEAFRFQIGDYVTTCGVTKMLEAEVELVMLGTPKQREEFERVFSS